VSRLVIYEGEDQRAEHVLARAVVGLGRHPQNDIVLDDRTLSRFHARIEKRDDHYVVIGLGQNGVHINGNRIDGEAPLATGDRIDLGKYTAVFQAATKASAKNGQASKNGKHVKVVEPPQSAPAKAKAKVPEPDLDMEVDLDVDLDDLADDIDIPSRKTKPAAAVAHFEASSQVEYVPPQPTLVLMFNQMEISRHPLTNNGLVIGRSKQCDIVISLLGLSRRHSQITMTDDGIVAEDLGSQNGTWVNNDRIEGQHPLSHGDTLNFYDYSVLFLEDGDVEVGFPGASFQPPAAGDDLGEKETNQALAPPMGIPAKPRKPTVRAPLTDAAPDDETALGRPRPKGKKTDGLELDDLGEGSYLGDEFEDGASKQRDNPLLDDDDDLGLDDDVLSNKPQAAPNGIGTELIDSPDLSKGGADEDLEADIAFSSSAASDEFVSPTTAGDTPRLGEKTSTGIDAFGALGGWPSDDDLEDALMVLEASSVTLEVTMKGKPYAQIPMSQPVMRLGSDPRCEISMPKSSGLRAWHVTFVLVGARILIARSNRSSAMEFGGADADVCLAKSGDSVKLGRVEILVRMRR